MTIVALFAVLLITVSAYSGRVYEAADGYKAPALTLSNSDTTLSLADLKGRYVVLAFWASNDAASRVEAGELDAFAMNADEEQFCLVSVNMDRSENLYKQILRRDNLKAGAQYHVNADEADKISEAYHLNNGFKSFLIDPEGRIIATNPTSVTLTQVLRN
ncbi:MAG: TlpA family protein disulfide reductase [Muribaculaceae bacterium]|nr:TlpA family protein disulfide reductase [Muribaculaceae bacterium]